jgi:hypothetical protein
MVDKLDIELLTKCYKDSYTIVNTRGVGEKPEDKIAVAILASTLFNFRVKNLDTTKKTAE